VPVLVATCTTNIVLAPIALMPGMGGFLFRPLALAVTFAMVTSFVLSRTFVPMMCAKFLPEEHGRGKASHVVPGAHHVAEHARAGWFGRLYRHIEHVLNTLTRRYEGLLALALRHRILVLTAVLVLFVGSLALTFGIGREFFPQVDAGQITIYVRSPSDTRLDAAERRVADVERFIEKHVPAGERDTIVSEMGLDPDWSVAYTANSGQQDAVIRVQLSEKRQLTAQEYAIRLRHLFAEEPRFADLRFNFDTGGMVSTALNQGASSPIDIQLEGGKTDQAFDLAKQIRNRVATVPGAADVRVQQRRDAPYKVIDVDRKKAADQGLPADDVLLQVVAAMNSSVSISRNFWIDTNTNNQYFVAVQYPEDPNRTLDDVLNVPATGGEQVTGVTLRSLVNIRDDTGAVEVNHFSLYRTFDVLLNTEGRDVAAVAADVQKRLQGLEVPQGMHVHMKGEYEQMNKTSYDLALGLVLAALLVYLLQVALFRSWVGPFIIMLTVPLGLIGVLGMLFTTRTTLNVQSAMGVIFLVGIAVNNGVLLVDFANKQRKLGADAKKAITTAAAIRFRPILMTFLATFLDLIPMAIGMGKGSEANVPLARAVVGGLLTSTCLTLFVVPIMYTLLMRDPLKPELDLEAEIADEPLPAGHAGEPSGNGATVPALGGV
jgi:multidrug efflux pump subunit AcrB